MKTIIVESKNDAAFVEHLWVTINQTSLPEDVEIEPIEPLDYKSMDGLSLAKLQEVLVEVLNAQDDLFYTHVGVLLDLDRKSKAERLALINEAIESTCKNLVENEQWKSYTLSEQLTDVNTSIRLTFDDFDAVRSIDLVCCFTHVAGAGELETLLKAIKTQESTYADCLEAWRGCLSKKNKLIEDKDFDKFWFNSYIRYDTCHKKKESTSAGKKCNAESLDYVFKNKPHIFDWNNALLDEIKTFLRLFI